MPPLTRSLPLNSRKPRRFVPAVEALEQRSLLAGIGHSHTPIPVAAAEEDIPARPAIVETTTAAAKATNRPTVTEERTANAASETVQLIDGDLSLTAALASAGFQTQTANNSGLIIAFAAAEHSGHSQTAFDAPLQSHGDHAAATPTAGSVVVTGAQSHGHSASLPEFIRAAHSVNPLSESSLLQGGDADASHHGGDDDAPAIAASKKFAPKRCTVRYTSKEVYRDVSGDRKCDCSQKAAAEVASRERNAADDETSEFSPVLASAGLADCLPCQLDAATNAAICRIATPGLSELSDTSSCDAERPTDDSWASGVTSFYEGLQLVGWTLVGTSVMAVSLASKRTSQPQDERERTSALDQFFGHLGLERLPR